MELSYWEYKTWLRDVDFTVIGSGIVGLSTALHLKQQYPKAKILVLEKGTLPQGASTKNAGFACFGSISELLDDLNTHSEETIFEMVSQRWQGIQLLLKLLGPKAIDYQRFGGHELFLNKDERLFERCLDQMEAINTLLSPIFKGKPFEKTQNKFGFQHIASEYITHRFEGQLDTGKMMLHLLNLVKQQGIFILNQVAALGFEDIGKEVLVKTQELDFSTATLLITTNGFAATLLAEAVKPARAQVLVTQPIKGLSIQGTFHIDQGYYYFRNIDGRVLLGGGRNLDFDGETTMSFGQTTLIQEHLETLLKQVILPHTDFEIAHRWSGIMGMGPQKQPIIKQLSNRVYCGVRLGGMGVAIGSLVGHKLAHLI
ncbi:MAG: FAD-dependent oxidoreductase [Bacteroidota bacterium]